MLRHLLVVCFALLALGAPAAAPAFAATPKTTLYDLEDEVMCPVCGVALNTAESPQADDQRRFMRTLIAQGATKQKVKDALVREYGEAVLATPDSHGFSIANWLVPAAFVALLLAVGAVLLPRWLRRRPGPGDHEAAATAAGSDLTSDERRRLDDDLARYE